jgi:glycosyltransferase involved in cell wall biosynthesis
VSVPSPVEPAPLTASVVVRARNKQATIERTLRVLRAQTVQAQVIVVDSGSTDRTLEIARAYDAEIIETPPAEFSYGRALNIGTEHADGDIVFALSAHSAPDTDQWIEWSLEAYQDPAVACTLGHSEGPDRQVLAGPRSVSAADLDLKHNVTWGLSNHASSWRRSVWEDFRFNEEIIACEDKEWMWRVLADGYRMVVDPRLDVGIGHRWAQGPKALYIRTFREWATLAEFVEFDTAPLRAAAVRWWSYFPYPGSRPLWQRRLNPRRSAEMAGEYLGVRAGARRRHKRAAHHQVGNTVRLASLDEGPELSMTVGIPPQ